jgi:glyoxylase-like metal-dependent hydrolase (beta-lactamase superfamily II)
MVAHHVADDLVVIDTMYNGTPEAIAAYLLLGRRPALIETGPASTVDALFGGMREAGVEPETLAAVAVTHIHLDHAGGAGTIAARLPQVQIYVHSLGAPHLIDPARLLGSAQRLYGDDLPRLFGRVVGVPAERVHALRDGDEIQLGDRRILALDTPGHARHHHAYWDPIRRDLFTGDIAGVALPGSRYVRAPTPPPEFDLSSWLGSLVRLRDLRPLRLLLTHFGAHEWPEELLAQLEERLDEAVDTVRRALARGADEAAITGQVREAAMREIAARDGPEAPRRYEVIMPVRQSVLGLIRYIEKSQEATRA